MTTRKLSREFKIEAINLVPVLPAPHIQYTPTHVAKPPHLEAAGHRHMKCEAAP